MSSTESDAAGQEPTEAEIRDYVDKLRSAPAQQILSELLFTALNAAQVKLGRKDARLFIDLSALMKQRLGDYLPADASAQVEQALGQLRMAQVQAERQIADAEPEEGDIDRVPTGIISREPDGQPAAAPSPPPSTGSKLWVPGQDL